MNKYQKLIVITALTVSIVAIAVQIIFYQPQQAPEKIAVKENFTPPCMKAGIASLPQSKITRQLVESHNLSMKESYYYDKIPETGEVICRLCPHKCILREGELGDCRVRANVEGKLRTLVYARPITMHLDPIEKKPFFHFLPTKKTLSIATAGCNLRCRNCQNWQISQLSPFEMENVEVRSPKTIVNLASKYNAKIISYTYNDPIVFFEYMLETAKLAHKNGIKNTMVTAGFINEEPMEELAQYIDGATVDIKGMTNEFYDRFNTGELDPVLDAIKVMKKEGVWLEISYLVIPGENDTNEDFDKFARWVKNNTGKGTPVHFLRFFPHYQMKSKPATPVPTLKRARKRAINAGLEYVYIGNVRDPETEDTFCPHCQKKIIDRNGYQMQALHVKDGKCEFCNKPINGIWK
ncbi:MAG TPA: AmmeMemoRadiSam system radical SAM enzyme [Salinivirga sp.]|uniref:AmmeMemoRadiSam system radical SAM enzyme n=1 Tax=Salinivirga sp. TaxID=1970192 RepID=UPI002B46ABA0|nr:AmmeMemoRadiSam system radical SAM enzyme [Salinivirga sp.]HKK59621.1 AmmeMemoRadiSam system radical SAM enzyme [Salinivirga sp.]